MPVLELWRRLGHEEVVLVRDRAAGLTGFIAIHDTTFGAGTGGTRFRPYPSLDEALADALRLSRAMTYKAVMAEVPRGGAKAVIVGDPARDKTPALLAAYAAAVDRLGGRFYSGPDMGIDADDVRALVRLTRHFSHVPGGAAIDVPDLTAIGVLEALRETARRLGHDGAARAPDARGALEGLHVVVQGLGAVGSRLARRLHADGARLSVADVDPERAARAASELDATVVAPEAVFDVPCDVFSPNAAGGVINDDTLPRLRCRAVVGAANEQLLEPRQAGALHARGILYAPDFVVNAGGLISVLYETGEKSEAETVEHTRRTGARLAAVFDRAAAEGVSPHQVAERTVEQRLTRARAARRG